jgi:hypothetical protein
MNNESHDMCDKNSWGGNECSNHAPKKCKHDHGERWTIDDGFGGTMSYMKADHPTCPFCNPDPKKCDCKYGVRGGGCSDYHGSPAPKDKGVEEIAKEAVKMFLGLKIDTHVQICLEARIKSALTDERKKRIADHEAAMKAEREKRLEAEKHLNKIAKLFSVGDKVEHRFSVILVNIENALRRSRCLWEVEKQLTTIEKDENGEEYEDCKVSWGAEPEKYAEQFSKALSSALKAKEEEIATLKENLNKVICVWCGHIGKKDAKELLDHVKECSKHPMKRAMDKLDELPKITKLIDALFEIQEMFDGEADIDNNGHSNRAMKIDLIIDEATKGFGR